MFFSLFSVDRDIFTKNKLLFYVYYFQRLNIKGRISRIEGEVGVWSNEGRNKEHRVWKGGELYSEGGGYQEGVGDILRRMGEIYTEGEVITKEERARVF